MAQIKKDTSLRKAILQAAITGQLISSCHSEQQPCHSELDSESPCETGKELLDKIIEERNNKLLAEWEEALKKNPKAKKPAPIVASEIDEEEIPFEIPENWCWCRLGDLFITSSGTTPASKNPDYYLNGTINWVRTTDLNNDILTSTEIKITEKAKEDCNLKIIPQDSVCIALYGGAGTIGKNAIIKFDTTINQSVCAIHPNNFCSMKYIQWFIQWQRPNWMELASGSRKDPNINQIVVKNCLIPLPPLAVQNTIVAKLEQVLPLVDAYENALLQKEELKSTLPDKVKKAILQEAITGQLTESWRKTATIKESGKQLLDRIIEERNAKALAEWEEALKKNPKAKKPVPVVASEIEEEEIPFEVPESWCWCRLGDLVPFGQCENAEPDEIEDDAWILDLEDIEKDSGRILQFKTKKEVDSKSTKHIFNKGYVLYSKLRPYLNKCVIAPQDGYCTSEILPLDFGKLINNKYAQTFLMSPYFVDYTDSLSFGVKMPRLGTEDGKKALVPLPPLEEQEEIVTKVEELLPLCK
ncbi:MAG: restriction endonuclease subunit S [Treponema sp.]|nr:restriction endonuclease subunit S [Treponema sp.]